MENKYYIPEISEFHVGFEYESKTLKNDVWEHRICASIDVFEACEALKYDENIVRVKYLDRQDIEECGWNYSNLAQRFCIIDESADGVNNQGLWLYYVGSKIRIADCRFPMHQVLFFGNIKWRFFF
jgi:hypothetical protein